MYPKRGEHMYGADAWLMGDEGSEGDKLYQEAMGTLGAPTTPAGMKRQEGAEGQLWQGIQQQQQLGQAMASRRGYNPLAARAATASGAELESQGFGAAGQLRAAEEAQRLGNVMAAQQARSQYDRMMGQLGTSVMQAGMEDRLRQESLRMAQEADDRARDLMKEQAILSGLQTTLTFPMTVGSDPAMKQNMAPGGAAIENLLRLGSMAGDKIGGGASGMGSLGALAGGIPALGAMVSAGQMGIPKQLPVAGGILGGAGLGGLMGLLSDEQTKMGIAPAGQEVEAALMPGDQGYRGVEEIYDIVGGRPEEQFGTARVAQSGEYGSATNPRVATMYLGNIDSGARVLNSGGEVEQTPWEKLVAGKFAPAATPIVASAPATVVAPIAATGPTAEQLAEALKGTDADMMAELTKPVATAEPATEGSKLTGKAREVYERMMSQIYGPSKPFEVVETFAPSEPPVRQGVTTVEHIRRKPTTETAAQALPAGVSAGDMARAQQVTFAPDKLQAAVPEDSLRSIARTMPMVNSEQLFAEQVLRQQQRNKQLDAIRQSLAMATESARKEAERPKEERQADLYDELDRLNEDVAKQLTEGGGVDIDAILGRGIPDEKKPEEVQQFLEAIKPISFNYDPAAQAEAARFGVAAPSGRQLGITTTDMAKSKLGREAIVRTPAGEAVSIPEATSLSLAAAAQLQRQIDDLKNRI